MELEPFEHEHGELEPVGLPTALSALTLTPPEPGPDARRALELQMEPALRRARRLYLQQDGAERARVRRLAQQLYNSLFQAHRILSVCQVGQPVQPTSTPVELQTGDSPAADLRTQQAVLERKTLQAEVFFEQVVQWEALRR